MSMLMLRINDDGLKSNLRVVRVVFPTLKIIAGSAGSFPDLENKIKSGTQKVYTIFNNSIAKSIYLRYVKVLPAVLPAKSVCQNLSNALFFSIFRYSCG